MTTDNDNFEALLKASEAIPTRQTVPGTENCGNNSGY